MSHPSALSAITCQQCFFNNICKVLESKNSKNLEAHYVFKTIALRKGETLYRLGEPFSRIFVVKGGLLKSLTASDYVYDFYFQGDLLGVDGVETEHYALTLVALDDTQICAFEFDTFFKKAMDMPILMKELVKLMGQQANVPIHQSLLHQDAEHRLCSFIWRLSQTKKKFGFSETTFPLLIRYKDIANHLRLSVETISRLTASLEKQGILSIKNKMVNIHDVQALCQRL